MISKEEISFRQKVFDIHQLEATDETRHLSSNLRKFDVRRGIKKFTRTSEDKFRFPVRSFGDLDITVNYLTELYSTDSTDETYSFVMDRMRCVGVDLIISGEKEKKTLGIYYKMIRFYIYSLCVYMAYGTSSAAFDRHLHEEQLNSSISSVLALKPLLITAPCRVLVELYCNMLLLEASRSLSFAFSEEVDNFVHMLPLL